MKNTKNKLIAIAFPIYGLLIWSLITMINSFESDENWKIIFSVIGFCGFFVLAGLFTRSAVRSNKRIEQE